MLYRMLCGRPPFIGDGAGAVMAMHIYEPPPPLRQFEPGIPEDLAGLVHQLLAKDSTQRPPMTWVAQQLEALKAIHTTGLMSANDLGLSTSQAYLLNPKTPPPIGLSQAGPNSLSMTLGQSAAQIGPTRRRGPLIAVLTIGGSLLVGAAIFFAVALNKGETDRRPTQPTVRVVHNVKWTISSDPPGATVLRALDQSEIGRTPWHTSQPAVNGQLIVILRHPGYADRVVTLDQNANAQIKESLSPLAVAVTPTETPPPPTTPTPESPQSPKFDKHGKKGKPGTKADGVATTATPDKTSATPSTTPTPPATPTKPKDETSNGRIQVVD